MNNKQFKLFYKVMNRQKIEVPEGIRFLSDWDWFSLDKFPSKCIINKQIPGCGFTEYCIRSNENIILCSPRKLLLKNKFDQHENEVYLVVNEMDKDVNVDKDLMKDTKDHSNLISSKEDVIKKQKEIEDKRHEIYQKLYSGIEEYKNKCFIKGKPMKILVTYDSYHIVVDILTRLNMFQYFYTVIDEFQSILHDSRFKSDTELGFLYILKARSQSAFFVSATPMMDEYLEMLDEFKDLPYFELDWYTLDHSRVIRPSLKVLTMKSVGTKAEEVIGKYLRKEFEEIVVMRDSIPTKVISNEAVLYVNSVNHIISIIKKCDLTPEQVNILCADTEDNKRKIQRKLGKSFTIGKVPKRDEYHKMFTFCTRTVYLGADFYSTCAQSFIFSDANSDCLAVDISEDLPQILGRQRLDENPWKNSATFYYRSTADYRKMGDKDFQYIINNKRKSTESLLRTFGLALDIDKQELAKNYEYVAKNANYKDNYVAVNKVRDEYGNIYLSPVLNNLVMVNEIRAFKIQQIDYADRFTVFSTIHSKLTKGDIVNQRAFEFMEKYNSLTEARKKLIFLCESSLNGELSKEVVEVVLAQIPDSDYIKSYYINLGPDKLKSLGYIRANIERALGIVTFSDELLYDSIYSEFKEGNKLSLSIIKQKLKDLYSSINYKSTPKASDLSRFFEVKKCKITIEGKRVDSYELLKSKEQELRQELKLAQ